MQFQYVSLQSKLKEAVKSKNQAIENLLKANFTLKNTQRENFQLTKKYEDAQSATESSLLTLKYNKEKLSELEAKLESI